MKLKKVPAFELVQMDSPCPSADRGRMVFKTYTIAERHQKKHGGVIKHTFLHERV